jgi:molybdopterin converting factor subunit 1
MRVSVKFFAILRDRAGVSETTLELSGGATVAMARDRLAEYFPVLKPLLARAAFAVNHNYVPLTTRLNDGDELAVIPPVSGG